MRTTRAIFKKQVKDLIKNKETLLMFLVFPGIAFLMTQFIAIGNPDIPNTTFVAQFMAMFSSMVMIQTTCLIIAEDKEKKGLRFLLMAGVKQHEYVLGIGGALMLVSVFVGAAFAGIGRLTGLDLLVFFAFFMVNILISILIGATLGLLSRNIQSATALTVPVAFLLGFLPMFAAFNENLYNVSRWIYSIQFTHLTADFSVDLMEPMLFTLLNVVLFAAVFAFVYRRKGLRA